jgi:DNA-directed RNA polymerase subunit E'/Rpb7
MNKIMSPYKNIIEKTRISLEPYQLTSDIRNHMKINLKKKVEKKCNKNGYIIEVYRITKYSDGLMLPENLNGTVIYEILFHCKICIPIENTIIISQVKVINSELVVTINGSIMTFIPRENIDIDIWNINENFTNKNDVKLNIGDYVKILILNKRINQGDIQIKTIGKLLDLATEKEVEQYFEKIEEDIIEIENTNDESNFII